MVSHALRVKGLAHFDSSENTGMGSASKYVHEAFTFCDIEVDHTAIGCDMTEPIDACSPAHRRPFLA